MMFTVTCWASQEISIEAESEDEAEEIAACECQFPWVDYCEISED